MSLAATRNVIAHLNMEHKLHGHLKRNNFDFEMMFQKSFLKMSCPAKTSLTPSPGRWESVMLKAQSARACLATVGVRDTAVPTGP